MKSTELFDNKNDPNERFNIAEAPNLSEVVKGLSVQLAAGWQKTVPTSRE